MEIKDTQAIYQFLGNLSWFGNIAFFILASIVIAFLTLNISEKIFDSGSPVLKRNTTLIIVLLVLVCGIILKLEANRTKEQLRFANAIKSYMLEYKKRYKSLKTLANDIVLNSDDSLCMGDMKCLERRIRKIKKLVEDHPDQFIIAPVNDMWAGNPEYSVEGLEIIDEKATGLIDSFENAMVPFYRQKILHYMQSNGVDTMSYTDIQKKVDGRCYENVLDQVVLDSKGALIPVGREGPAIVRNKEVLSGTVTEKPIERLKQ